MNLWSDGRSGPAGSLAGNLVLARLRDTDQETFAERKGTTFFGRTSIWIGRICSTDAYLYGRDRHWANCSLEQHGEVTHEAELEGRSVKYLFITALKGRSSIHFWVIPGKVIEHVAFSDRSLAEDFVYSLHIREENGRFSVEREDVTAYHRVLELGPSAVSRLDRAFEDVRRRRERRTSARQSGPRTPRDSADSPASELLEPRRGRFDIPLNGGRTAVLQLPLPAADVDLNRIKGWIDLMNDVLTEPLKEDAEKTELRRSRAAQAVATLQTTSAALGADRIDDAEIDLEISKARRGSTE